MSEQQIAERQACGCCAGTEQRTPAKIDNRPGLSAIAYRIGNHSDFLKSMLAKLSSGEGRALAELLTRDGDDLSIALLDAWATVADVLTFYQERLANESYLLTATERVSLQELGRLLSYRLRPGVAAETYLAFTVERPHDVPDDIELDPGMQPPAVPEEITLEAGIQVQSVPGPEESPQVFETVEEIAARPEWNVLRPRMSEPYLGAKDAYIEGVAANLKPGDALLFVVKGLEVPTDSSDADVESAVKRTYVEQALRRVGYSSSSAPALAAKMMVAGPDFSVATMMMVDDLRSLNRKESEILAEMLADIVNDSVRGKPKPEAELHTDEYAFRVLTEVEGDADAGRTHVKWKLSLGSELHHKGSDGLDVLVLRRRASVFGHNAPMWKTMPSEFRLTYPDGGHGSGPRWPNFEISTERSRIDLDAVYSDIAQGSWVVLVRPGCRRLFEVSSISEISRAAFAISAKITRLTLTGEDWEEFETEVRSTTIYGAGEELTLVEAPVEGDVTGGSVLLGSVVEGLPVGRTLIVSGADTTDGKTECEFVTLKGIMSSDGLSKLRFEEHLAGTYARDSVRIYANVARATHGQTVYQILGSGNAGREFQGFELLHSPLTHTSADTPGGTASSLIVRVNDIKWHESPTLFDAESGDRVFVTRDAEDGKTIVAFGDGSRGSRVPSGQQNVQAQYRKGIGADGNVPADTVTQLMTRPLGLKAAVNPRATEGGADPERTDEARRNIPLGVRTLGRAVSLRDYEDYARSFAGVAKAHAAVLSLRAGRTIVVSVSASEGQPLSSDSELLDNLASSLREYGDPLVPIEIRHSEPTLFELTLNVKYDPDYLSEAVAAGVREALCDAFSFDERGFCQPVLRSEVIAVAHRVPGVVAVDIDYLFRGGTASLGDRVLASRPCADVNGNPVPAELLVLNGESLIVGEMA